MEKGNVILILMFYVNITAHIVPQISLLSAEILHNYSNY